jgi:hypothetical protein
MLAFLALATPAAAGGPAPKASDEETELVRRGTEAFVHQDYDAARAAFARAYELQPKPKTLLQLGLAELHSDHPVEAAGHLREYLTHTEEPADKLDAVRTKWLARAEARTARLEITAPAGAEVAIDGAVQGQAPLSSIVVREGEHDVTARHQALAETRHIRARGGELVDVHFQLASDPAPAAAPSPVSTASGSPVTFEPPPKGSLDAKWIAVLATGSGAVVAAGIGIGFALASQQSAKDVRGTRDLLDMAPNPWSGSECQSPSPSAAALCSRLDSQTSTQSRQATISNWAYGIAGALGVASVVSFLFWPSSSVRLEPTVGGRSAGLSAGGEW